ncbi:MAG TPA: IMP dehydrogenase, partial [Campylobacteraceae bacterium]|nr:IMP dehydrogenase [Campylobacteraceae bacterium]
LACTPSPESAHAIEGFVDRKCETEFSYENRVERIFESPRVTKPYKEEQWEAIRRLGFHVDKDLSEGDVRLTMGGEPTFVSIDDMEAPEWNTEADGPHKRALADTLSRRLMERFGPGGFLHHAQGKWYPGEPLPRWKTTIYWRKDGKPIWRDHTYLSGLHEHHDYTTEDAKRFLSTLSLALGVSEQNISPAYEDAFYYAYKESQLPPDVDPLDVDLDDDLERRTLAEVLKKGLGNPVGYVLPLGWGTTRWITSKWEFRRKHLFLLPGNSPIGLRLPLDSLTAKPHIELEKNFEPDLFADYPQLGDYHASAEARLLAASPETTPNRRYEAFVRTGICAEVREDRLYLFLPPIEKTEAYLDLIASIEVTARTLDMRVVLEGYEPPTDNRIEKISVTPDPGVIEVNIHPADSWQMLLENTHTLYEEAKLSRLGTEKFMIDGRHTGTGGGNHVTLGGRKPSDSPLLRRPDLLRSLITFWQHHPGLSYLFSGAFIGPTSQAPRVDEGRMENLYDLEIAFDQIPENQPVPYWLTDRLFRNFLTDITGNTHRSEFCIDKLYSPDSPTGRLGLLELRAFDMPPHYQMSLLQMLLVRALVAAFWKNPYKHPLVRWGTQLHDKYLLEHYVREDIASVVDYLNSAGYAFETSWFDPFFEFRFPTFGMPVIEGMRFELRGAIEPWHVLGEESTGQGTSRYVDSSMERIQLKVSDFVSERYIVACNGVKVPLAETDTKGVYTAGVRYKAWKPWSALHPTIDIDAPLVFDVVDTWNNRSIGGFTYFVTHPGGRSYDTFPVNVLEAESRRVNRFWEQGHSQGPVVPESMQPPAPFVSAPEAPSIGAVREVVNTGPEKGFRLQEVPISREYPHTLDLRRKKR